MKKSLLLFSALLTILSLSARPKDGHYAGLDNKSNQNLWDAIYTVTQVGYSDLSYDGLITAYQKTDVDDNGQLIDMYGGCSFAFSKTCGNYSGECDCYNREHSMPKSWWGSSPKESKQGSDIFHVVPTDGYVNNRRSNYAFGEVSNATYTYNGNKLGSSSMSGYSGTVFEPQNEYKGDFARGYFGTMAKWEVNASSGNGGAIFNGTYTTASNYGLTEYGIALLMKWHREDPVSEKELKRNDAIEATQGNRNPFIDYPELAEYLWGTKKGQTVVLSELTSAYDGGVQVDVPTLFSPTDNSDIQFGNVTLEKTISKSITVKGALLENAISLSISGEDASQFTVSPSAITAAQANAGQPVAVIYTPATEGLHTATLYLRSSDFSTIAVNLEGTGIVAGSGDDDEPEVDIPDGDYVKVTSNRDDWTGTYLIVYETKSECLNATMTSSDNGVTADVTISDNTIAGNEDIDSYAVTISASGNGYVLKTSTGMYVGNSSKKFAYSTSPTVYTISCASGIVNISNGSYTMKYNTGISAFRFYTSGQESIQIYRKEESTATDIENYHNADCKLHVQENTLLLTTEQPANVAIYDYTGRTILHNTAVTQLQTHLPQGIYVVQINGKAQKIWVK